MTHEEHGPDGLCTAECREVRFGVVPMPAGYSVWWHADTEHYQGHAPNGDESAISVDRHQCRRWCVEHAHVGADAR